MRLLTRSSVRYLVRHRGQLVLSILGVALGVAVVVAIDLAVQSARTGFRVSAETVAGRATHQVVGPLGSVDERILTRLRTELGVRAAAPVIEGFAASPSLPGQALTLLGVDPFSEAPFRPYVSGSATGLDVGGFVTRPGAVVLALPTAERAGVAAGDSLPIVVEGRAHTLTVVGTLDPVDRLARIGLGDVLLVDISSAQDLLGMQGRLTRIDLALPDGPGDGARIERIRAALPPDAALVEAGSRSDTMAGMIEAFDLNLTALSLLALVFGMFLIYNAMTFSVVQRRELLGRLRTLGVRRGELMRTILGEAAFIGAAGAVLGVLAGAALGRGLVRLVTRTINDLYFAVSVDGVGVDPAVLLKGLLLGVGATLVAAVPPALEAASADPRLATLRSHAEGGARRSVPRAALLGAVLLVAGGVAMAVPSRDLLLSFAALFLVILGMALLTPLGTVVLVRAVRPLLTRTTGVVGTMAARGVVTSLTRTAPAVAALVVAVSVTVGLGVMIQSFRGTLVRWLDGTVQADVYVSLPGPRSSRASGTMPPELIDRFVSLPGVAGHSTYRGVDVVPAAGVRGMGSVYDAVPGGGAAGPYQLIALDLDPDGEAAFDFLEGDPAEALAAFRSGDAVIVSEPFAYRRGLSVGDAVVVPTPGGDLSVPISGVFHDYGAEQGTVMIARALYDAHFEDPGVTSLALFLAPDTDALQVVDDLLAAVPDGRTVVARTNGALREASLAVFDRTFRITAVLRLLAFIVAFVGVLSALMALELERARELGVLRAIGLTPGQVRQLVISQTGLLGLVSGLLAVPVGLVLSAVMIFVINKRSFGWSLDMEVGPVIVAQAVGLALAGAIIAGVYPARRMSATQPAVALRGE